LLDKKSSQQSDQGLRVAVFVIPGGKHQWRFKLLTKLH
jgi:hypothetical protein